MAPAARKAGLALTLVLDPEGQRARRRAKKFETRPARTQVPATERPWICKDFQYAARPAGASRQRSPVGGVSRHLGCPILASPQGQKGSRGLRRSRNTYSQRSACPPA